MVNIMVNIIVMLFKPLGDYSSLADRGRVNLDDISPAKLLLSFPSIHASTVGSADSQILSNRMDHALFSSFGQSTAPHTHC